MEEENILESDDEEKNKVLETTYLEDTMMDLKEEEEGTKPTTPRLEMGSNDVNSTPREIGSPQYVQHRDGRYHWYSKEVEARHLEQLWITQVGRITFLIGKNKFQLTKLGFVNLLNVDRTLKANTSNIKKFICIHSKPRHQNG